MPLLPLSDLRIEGCVRASVSKDSRRSHYTGYGKTGTANP